MTISRRGIFGIFAGAATVAVAKTPAVEQSTSVFPTAGLYHDGRLFLKYGHRVADPVLLTFDEVNMVPKLWTTEFSAIKYWRAGD